jgi:hypothetical protein
MNTQSNQIEASTPTYFDTLQELFTRVTGLAVSLRYAELNPTKNSTLAGRAKFMLGCHSEDNDCTVIALSVALAVPYDVAHKILADQGRKPLRGFKLTSWLQELSRTKTRLCGYTFTAVVAWECPTLARVARDFPKGRFILRKRGHALAMVDGVVHDFDLSGPRTRITHLFLLERA